jgi:hypothetical protein
MMMVASTCGATTMTISNHTNNHAKMMRARYCWYYCRYIAYKIITTQQYVQDGGNWVFAREGYTFSQEELLLITKRKATVVTTAYTGVAQQALHHMVLANSMHSTYFTAAALI